MSVIPTAPSARTLPWEEAVDGEVDVRGGERDERERKRGLRRQRRPAKRPALDAAFRRQLHGSLAIYANEAERL